MRKKQIKNHDQLIKAIDIYNIVTDPTIFQSKAKGYQKLRNISETDPFNISDLSEYLVSTFEQITPKEINNNECVYLITKDTAYKILKNEFKKLMKESKSL